MCAIAETSRTALTYGIALTYAIAQTPAIARCATIKALPRYEMMQVAPPYAMTKSARLDLIWTTIRPETMSAPTRIPAAKFR